MTLVDLSIIIVNWDSKDYVRNCIASILANTFDIDYEIIVVDSASFDGCGEMLQAVYPHVRFIQCGHNVGFGRANNLGATYARGNMLLLLNPDTEVRAHTIKRLYTSLTQLPRAGVIGCRLLNTDGSLQATCVQPFPTIVNQVLNAQILQRWFSKTRLWMTAATFEGVTSPPPVEVVTGACMMIMRDVFEAVKGFSPDYFMYAEDLDLCYKVRAAGFTNYYVPEVEIVHHGGGSTQRTHRGFSSVMKRESVSRLLRKTRGNLYSLGYRLALSGAAIVRLILLGLYWPVALVKRRTGAWSAAFDKWIAILRWGMGLETWIYEYDQPDGVVASMNGGEEN
jgi:GT2 family glycosyltransferase